MNASVTLVVPVYNVRAYLAACVTSLIRQTCTSLEIILVDDGATDGSAEMVAAYAARYEHVRAVHKENGGLSDARNAGLAAATGEYVMFIDADDWAEPGMVERMLVAATTHDADVVVSGFIIDYEDAQNRLVRSDIRTPQPTVIKGQSDGSLAVDAELVNSLGYAWNKLYRRRMLLEGGFTFRVGVSLVEDALFNSPILVASATTVLMDEAFVHYVQRSRETLGTRHYPDYVALRFSAIEALEQVLTTWRCDAREVELVFTQVRMAALSSGVRRAVYAGEHARDGRREVLAMLDHPHVRDWVLRRADPNVMRPRDRVLFEFLRGKRVGPLLAAVKLSRRLRRRG